MTVDLGVIPMADVAINHITWLLERPEDLLLSCAVALFIALGLFVVAGLLEPVVLSVVVSIWTWAKGEKKSEQTFPSGSSRREKFPSINTDPASIDLSIVILAKNDEARLAVLLDEVLAFFQHREVTRSTSVLSSSSKPSDAYKYEIIVVDMASTDSTAPMVLRFTNKFSSDVIRLLRLDSCLGTGQAMMKGVARTRGQYILVTDGSGAVPFEEISRLERGMAQIESKSGLGCVLGSRAHLQINANFDKSQRLLSAQKVLLSMFQIIFQLLCVRDVYDPQCPFKLFSRAAARRLFWNQHLFSICADSELVFLASRLQIPVKELAVNWNGVYSNSLTVKGYLQLLKDLVVMRACYMFGLWRVSHAR